MKKIISYLLVLAFLVGCGSSPEKEVKEEVKSEYGVGETVELKGMNITLNKVRIVPGDEFFKPDEGKVWIALDFTFENTTDESVYVAGIFDITLRDDNGVEKEMNIWGDIAGSLDADVMSNDKLSGEKSFVVDEGDTKLTAYYKSTFTNDKPIKFVFDLEGIE